MSIYADSSYQPSDSIKALHAGELESFGQCGTWGSAAQRTAVAALTRKVRAEAGLQESVGDESLADLVELPGPVQRLVRETALGGVDIDRAFYEQVLSEGVTEGAYVEIVALVSRIVNLDIFARGVGVAPRPLPSPGDDKKPAYGRPQEATDDSFYAASVPCGKAGGEAAKTLYGGMQVPNVFRGASLVPDEAARIINLVQNQYLPAASMMDFGSSGEHALSRAQIETVATKVSEHNKCFY